MQTSPRKCHLRTKVRSIAKKVRSIFDKFLPRNKEKIQQFKTAISFKIGDKVYFKSFNVENKNCREGRNYSTPWYQDVHC